MKAAMPAQGNAQAEAPAKPAAAPAAPAAPANSTPAKAAPKPPAAGSPSAPAPKAAAEAVAQKEALPVVVWADVEPLFAERCAGCHDPDTKKGGLDISSFAATRQGGGSGKTIVPGNPDASRLFRMVAQQETPVMPKDADPLEAPALAKIRQWIEQGAAEDAASARAFVAEKEAKAKATAAAVEASMSGPPPLPENWPDVPVRLPPRTVPIAALARSPRAPLLILPGVEQLLLLNDALKIQGVLPCALPRTGAIAFSFDGTLLAAAGGESGRNGKALIFDVKTGALQGSYGKERDIPLAIAVHKGRGLVALGGSSKHTRVFVLADGSEQLDGKHDDFVLGLDFSPDGSLLAAADRSGAVILWETDGGRIAQTLRAPKGAIQATAFHKSGRMVAAAVGDGTVRMFDVQDGKEKWSKQAHQGEALTLAMGPGNRLATGGTDGRIAVLDDSGKAIATSDSVGDQIQALAFGDSDAIVIGGDPQGRLHRFDVKAKKVTTIAPRQPAQ
jgi:outer membrane protein assembly factor BamB